MIAEAIAALGWPTATLMGTTTAKFVQETGIDAHMFWANKVRTASKSLGDKGAPMLAWLDAIAGVLNALKAYVADVHKAGVAWGQSA